jgi:lysophospholipid acyltransferase (LPLAT)-like uncharacterized protein
VSVPLWQRPAQWGLAALAATWRFEIVGAEHRDRALAAGTPIVWTHWHGHLLPLFWLHRHRRLTVLISRHADGERLVDLAQRWGYRALRGSSTRGAVTGLLGLARALERGDQVALAVDGPRGPRHVVKAGALALARKSRATVVAVAAWAAPAWRARSWDGFLVPAPGARVRVAYAEPWQAARPPEGDEGADGQPLQRRLDWATRLAAW